MKRNEVSLKNIFVGVFSIPAFFTFVIAFFAVLHPTGNNIFFTFSILLITILVLFLKIVFKKPAS